MEEEEPSISNFTTLTNMCRDVGIAFICLTDLPDMFTRIFINRNSHDLLIRGALAVKHGKPGHASIMELPPVKRYYLDSFPLFADKWTTILQDGDQLSKHCEECEAIWAEATYLVDRNIEENRDVLLRQVRILNEAIVNLHVKDEISMLRVPELMQYSRYYTDVAETVENAVPGITDCSFFFAMEYWDGESMNICAKSYIRRDDDVKLKDEIRFLESFFGIRE